MRLRQFNKKEPVHKNVDKVVIDTHGTLQDIVAIIIAHKISLRNEHAPKIIGITCVTGKNSVDDAIKSALAVNLILGTQIPVFRGQQESLMLRQDFPKVYGDQNFAHIEKKLHHEVDKHPELQELVQKEKASDYLIRISAEHKDKLAVVALGPHTNLGLAHRIEDCFNEIGMVALNGGQYMGVGNTVGGHVEANYAFDPLASDALFEIRQPKDLRDILYTNPLQNTLCFNWKQTINSCLEYQGESPLHPLLDEILQNLLSINSLVLQNGPLLTLLPIFAPKVVLNMYRVFGQIVRDGYDLDGLLAINWLKDGAQEGQYPNNVYVYGDFDQQLVEAIVKDAVLPA